MADRYHLRGTTNWNQAASWHDGVYGASGIPADTDTVFFLEGQSAVVSGLDQTGIDLTAIYESPGFAGRVGSDGESLKLELNQGIGTFDKGGNGTWYIAPTTTGGGAGTVKVANLRSGASTWTAGTVDAVNVYGGIHRFTGGCDLNTNAVIIKGGEVTIDFKASDAPNVTVHSGIARIYRTQGTLTIKGGRAILMVMDHATGATTATVEGDGILDIRAGHITTLNANSGLVDFSKMVKNITLTNSTYNGARAIARNGANGLVVTYTNAPAIPVPPDADS